ncbi:hypothetical protein MY5147_007552 [Beauveria neobassiana]
MGLIDLPPELLVAIALLLGSTRSISRRDANGIIPKSLAAGAHVDGSLYILKAAETGNAALVRILLEAGAKVNSTCWMGTSVLGYAMEANNMKTVHLLFSQLGIDLDYWCRHQEPVLLTAVARDKLDLAEVLLPLVDANQIGQEGITPLRLAVREQKASVVSLLLSDSRTNPNAMTAPSFMFALACSLPSAKIAELLHDYWRTDVEFNSRIDQTPAKMAFYHAEAQQRGDSALPSRQLFAHGNDELSSQTRVPKPTMPRHQGNDDALALQAPWAHRSQLSSFSIFINLQYKKAALNMAENRLQRLPLELLQMVVSHLDDTASISRLCRSGRHLYNDLEEYLYRYDAVVSIARKSLEAGADVNFCVKVYYRFSRSLIPQHYRLEYNDRGSILSAAVARGCFPLVKVLVHFKADINRRTEKYETAPIAIAVLKPGSGILRFLLRQPTLDLSASRTGYFGQGSALHLAVLLNQLNYVKRLVPYADSQVDNGPWNPLLCRVDVDLCGKLNPNAPDELNGIVDPAWLYTFHEKYQVDELSELNELNELNELEYPPARFAMMYYGHGEIADFLIHSSKCKTARDYIFRAACARERIELAHKVVRLAEDRDKKHAKRWIEQAELYNLHGVARSIREKWGDV